MMAAMTAPAIPLSYEAELEQIAAESGLTQVDDLTPPPGHGIMSMLSQRHGDLRLMWDKSNPDEVASAEATFKRMTEGRSKHIAYEATGKDGAQGPVMRRFNPDVERLIFVRQNQAG